jgi:hypothetical protein
VLAWLWRSRSSRSSRDLSRRSVPALGGRLIEFIVIIAALCWMAGFGLAAAQAAIRLERAAPIWFAFGAILGPIALLLLRAAPPGRCRSCGTPTRGWLRVCWWCREDVTATPATTLAMVARMSGPAEVGEVSRGREPARRNEPARPFQVQSDAFRPSRPATVNPPTPLVLSTSPTPTPASRPMATQPTVVAGQDGSLAPGWSPALRASKLVGSGGPDAATKVLATAVYVTGSARLESGRRYSIAVRGSRLQILGPTDIDPSAIVLDRPVGEVDSSAVEGRLIVSEPRGRSGLVLAFMSVAGPTTDHLAQMIRDAARESIQP